MHNYLIVTTSINKQIDIEILRETTNTIIVMI